MWAALSALGSQAASRGLDYGFGRFERADNYRDFRKSTRFGINANFNDWTNRLEYMQDTLGLTPSEIAGTPALSGGGSSGGTFGNTPRNSSNIAAATEAITGAERNEAQAKLAREQLETQKEIAGIQADTAREVAEISAEAPRSQAVTAADRLELDKAINDWKKAHDQERVAVLVAQAKREAEKFDIEKPTFYPAFVLHKQAMSMGPDNLRASALYSFFKGRGIDILDRNNHIKSVREMQEIMDVMRAENSYMWRELSGAFGASEMIFRYGNKTRDDDLPREPDWKGPLPPRY